MHLHVVSFDIPYPPTYGGVIDVFYRIRALAEAGVRVHLHCFEYKRPQAPELAAFCESVAYYPRQDLLRSLPVRYPHIVKSRASEALLSRLLLDDIPILFEGLHSTYFLTHPEFQRRLRLVRMHNIEWEYYYQLAQRESGYLRKQYYLAESQLLRTFEETLAAATHILTISPRDTAYYLEKFPQTTRYLPPFHAHTEIRSRSGTGGYALYHAKLSVPENHEAAMFLIREVFAHLDVPLIIAGSEALPELITAISGHENILLRPDPGEGEMLDLWLDAQIHVLPTFQATGIKLKLINALYNGRWVLVNPPMVYNTGLEFGCVVARDAEEYRREVLRLMGTPFSAIEIAQRKALLRETYSNERNARHLISMIYGPRPDPALPA